MSPKALRARISTVPSPGCGRSPRPARCGRGRSGCRVSQAATPSPDRDLQLAVAGLCHDGAARDLAEADVAVRVLAATPARHGRRHPAVGCPHRQLARDLADPGVAVGVLDLGRSIDAADLDGARLVASSAFPAACSTVMSPAPVRACTGPACSTRISPTPAVSRHAPRRPLQRIAAAPASTCRSEPAGRATSTSIDSPPPRGAHCRQPFAP